MTDEEVERAILSLYSLYSEIAARIEAIRILCVENGVFTQAEFEHGAAELSAKARAAGQQALAAHQPEQLATLFERLQSSRSKPQ